MEAGVLSRLLPALVPVLLILNACGPSSPAAPTMDIDAIYTAARQTFSAPTATPAASLTRTALPSPATSASATMTPGYGFGSICDRATYVSDVTIPDGSVIGAGKSFVKTWRLQNTGTCTWAAGYKLSFVSGSLMGGTDVVVPVPVPSYAQSDISVNLTAPASPGTYTGQWQMRNARGQAFGDMIAVVISVGSSAECHTSSRVQVTISGHTGPDRVAIDYGDGVTETDSEGNYAFTVPMGWSGTVIPSKAKVNPWTFDPPQRTYTNVTCDLTHQNYKAIAPPGV